MEGIDLYKRVPKSDLVLLATKAMMAVGCNAERAEIVADNLVEADMRGVYSHGIARLQRYLTHISQGIINPANDPTVVFETPVSCVMDGNNGVGQYVAKKATEKAIEKASMSGIGLVSVRHSNHYGIAGYWAEMIMQNEMIGISSTNTAPLVVPTFGKKALLGTSPLAFAFPSDQEDLFMMDMATSVVPRGKLEVYARNQKSMPDGWCVDESGHSTKDPDRVLKGFVNKSTGGILPLGGEGEDFGGHKGFGLGLLVELITAGFSLGAYSGETYQKEGDVCHFFGAIRLDVFGNTSTIKSHISSILQKIKGSEKADGTEEIYLHNEKEVRARKKALSEGVGVDEPTHKALLDIVGKYNLGTVI